jgi:hypothetical protein
MRALFFLIALILLGRNVSAQQNYFNKRLDFNQSAAENGFSILHTDTGSVTVFQTTNSIGFSGTLQVGVLLLSDTGLIQGSSIYSVPNHKFFAGQFGALLKINNHTLILPGTVQDTVGNNDAVLTRFDSLNITWQHFYGDTLFQAGRAVKRTRDGGFILIGDEGSYMSSNSDILTIKTDSNGIEQWSKRYGGQYSELGLDLDTCYDGGYILCGRTRSYGIGASIFWGNAYAIKTDSAGNEIWSKTFGNIYEDRFWSCLQASDGNYVFAGFYTYYDLYWPNYCCFSNSKPFIVKLDTAGNTIWAKVFGAISLEHGITSIKELPNGDYISAGYLDYDDSVSSSWRGFILKTNSNGDSLWYYTYRGAYAPNSDSFLYDVALDNVGGFLATGWVVPQLPDTGNQDIWVLKVDSNGCEVFNCLYTSGGEVINNMEEGVSVYPNPVSSQLAISSRQYAIKTIEIYNVLGENVYSEQQRNGEREISIDVSDLNAGIYLYRVRTEYGKVWTGKMVKE